MDVTDCGYYGKVEMPPEVFEKLNSDFFINGSSETIKFLCANSRELHHLAELGVQFEAVLTFDWLKVVRV